MNRQAAEKIIAEYVKPVFGFALKRCRTPEDAADLAQEIMVRAWRALTARDDIRDEGKFIWTVAHNALSNYYRDSAGAAVGVSIDEIAELSDPDTVMGEEDDADTVGRLRREIAYLSKLQRKIVIAYYFENKKQADIADTLGIPLGTVKWHLFEAKKELKRGIETVRKASDLTFNPIKFGDFGICGSVGTKEPGEFFRSALIQNICYAIRHEAKSIHEIADDLGVSPVYVETEVADLETHGYLQKRQDKYISNFIIYELTSEFLEIQNEMYKRAAELFANDLYDELTACGILNAPGIICHQTDEPISLTASPKADQNFLLWTLIPYIAAQSGESLRDSSITFEEVATMRPDGAHNIFSASVVSSTVTAPKGYVHMKNWCGPMWNGNGEEIFWQIDSQWSNRPSPSERNVQDEHQKALSLYRLENEADLTKLDYAWLAEKGYVKTTGDFDGMFKSSWQIVTLESKEIHDRLLAVGEKIKAKHKAAFEAIKQPYAKAVLNAVPPHLRRVKEYELQSVFHTDGCFLLHCIVCLLENGKLKEPTEGQRKALTTLIAKIK